MQDLVPSRPPYLDEMVCNGETGGPSRCASRFAVEDEQIDSALLCGKLILYGLFRRKYH